MNPFRDVAAGNDRVAQRDAVPEVARKKQPRRLCFDFGHELWILLDNDYIQRKLTDLELHDLLALVKENVLSINIFLKQILCSVRSDEVRKEAALKLYEFTKTSPPDPYDHEKALKTFLPTMFAQREIPKTLPASYSPVVKKHLVTDGDSLWKISRKYKVSIESIRDHNHLKTDKLKPGQELLIP